MKRQPALLTCAQTLGAYYEVSLQSVVIAAPMTSNPQDLRRVVNLVCKTGKPHYVTSNRGWVIKVTPK